MDQRTKWKSYSSYKKMQIINLSDCALDGTFLTMTLNAEITKEKNQ